MWAFLVYLPLLFQSVLKSFVIGIKEVVSHVICTLSKYWEFLNTSAVESKFFSKYFSEIAFAAKELRLQMFLVWVVTTIALDFRRADALRLKIRRLKIYNYTTKTQTHIFFKVYPLYQWGHSRIKIIIWRKWKKNRNIEKNIYYLYYINEGKQECWSKKTRTLRKYFLWKIVFTKK